MSKDDPSEAPSEREIVDAIRNGDKIALERYLQSSANIEELLTRKISIDRPTNHAIGKDASLLQFSAIRNWQDKNISQVLLNHDVEIDIHSACGLGLEKRINEIFEC